MTPKERGWSEGWGLVLYGLTLLLEWPGVVARFLFGLLLAPIGVAVGNTLLVDLTGAMLIDLTSREGSQTLVGLAMMVGVAPVLLSLLTLLVFPGGFLLTRWALGARVVSQREQVQLVAALREVVAQAPAWTLAPTHWFILDQPTLNACVVGTTLYLSREALRSPHLPAILAHELAHLNSWDGRLTLALRRLAFLPAFVFSRWLQMIAPRLAFAGAMMGSWVGCLTGLLLWLAAGLLALAGGGLGVWLLRPLWIWYWRQREYDADAFTARCGLGGLLIEYLETHQFFDVAAPYFLSEHPPTELRIDQLLAYEAGGQ